MHSLSCHGTGVSDLSSFLCFRCFHLKTSPFILFVLLSSYSLFQVLIAVKSFSFFLSFFYFFSKGCKEGPSCAPHFHMGLAAGYMFVDTRKFQSSVLPFKNVFCSCGEADACTYIHKAKEWASIASLADLLTKFPQRWDWARSWEYSHISHVGCRNSTILDTLPLLRKLELEIKPRY